MDRVGQIEQKQVEFEVKAAMMDEGQYAGTFEGYAAGILNLDSTGDVIMPGAFTEDLGRFLKEGVIVWQHDWMQPIGVPLEVREDGYGLFTKGRISKTTKGEEAMTLIRDRVIKKLSIGYQVLDYEMVDRNGLMAATDRVAMPIDKRARILSDFDLSGRRQVALLKKLKLFEYSPVTVPANNNAIITDAKSLLTGLTFAQHSEAVLTAVDGLHQRISEITELRRKQDRMPNPEHGRLCMGMAEDLEKACGRMRKLAEELGYMPESAPMEGDGMPMADEKPWPKPYTEEERERMKAEDEAKAAQIADARRAYAEFLRLEANL